MAQEQVAKAEEISVAKAALPSYQVITLQKAATPSGLDAQVVSNAFEPEDEFQNLYLGSQGAKGIIMPPFNLKTLDRLTQENNALGPCIEAMVTNIDGTGFDLENDDTDAADTKEDGQIDELWDFFNEPWPGESFITIRKQLRRDMEKLGNAYLEIVRNAQDEIVFVRHVDAKMVRMVMLDDAVPVKKTVTRKGAEVTISISMRERRFCQLVNGKTLVYFKDFQASRDLDKATGQWAATGQRLGFQQRSTEMIHFSVIPDAHTPYGVPRWITQLPSVLGSRKAEEFNLEFFNNGGVPPVMILLSGGSLNGETQKAIEQKTSGTASKVNRVQVIQVDPTGGSLTTPGNSKVQVERFGSERQNDSMFEKYDDKCELRVRRAFRLPPLFVGQASDYSFACYDDQTETLTDSGWIRSEQYKPGMKIACYDRSTGGLVYHEPEGGLLSYDVADILMHRFRGEGLDLLVTPNHRMLYNTQHGVEHLSPVEDMIENCSRPNFTARIDTYEEGEAVLDFAPPWVPLRGGSNLAYDLKPLPLEADDFLELLGWYLSEGHALAQGSAFSVCQKKSRHWPRIRSLLARVEARGYAIWWNTENKDTGMMSAAVANNSLYHWLRQNVGLRGHEKRIPSWIRGLRREHLAVLFDAMMAGDGTVDSRASRRSGAYSTVSKGLADDVQEIAIKLGYRTKLRQEPPGTGGIRPVYRVLLSRGARAGGTGRTQAVRYGSHYGRELYTGRVYCFSVPTGVFVTRRNGVVAIQGNTAFASYTVAEAQVFKPERDEFDEIMSIQLIAAMGYKGIRMRSKPLGIKDASTQMAALELVAPLGTVAGEDLIAAVNEVSGLSLKYTEPPEPPAVDPGLNEHGQVTNPDHPAFGKGIGAAPLAANFDPGAGPKTSGGSADGNTFPPPAKAAGAVAAKPPVGKPSLKVIQGAKKSEGLLALATDMSLALRSRDVTKIGENMQLVMGLSPAEQLDFKRALSTFQFIDPTIDPDGLAELAGCTVAVMAAQQSGQLNG